MAKSKKTDEKESEESTVHVHYIGPGGLSGEYLFKEFAGSIAAGSLEEAIQKAEELYVKHPSLIIK